MLLFFTEARQPVTNNPLPRILSTLSLKNLERAAVSLCPSSGLAQDLN
jgi:hypothetical protein